MHGVERAQHLGGDEDSSFIEEIPVEIDLVESGELAPRVGDGRLSPGEHGPDDLHSGEGAGHTPLVLAFTKEAAQRVGLDFALHQLHDGRRVEIELQRSSARIAARVAPAAIP